MSLQHGSHFIVRLVGHEFKNQIGVALQLSLSFSSLVRLRTHRFFVKLVQQAIIPVITRLPLKVAVMLQLLVGLLVTFVVGRVVVRIIVVGEISLGLFRQLINRQTTTETREQNL